MSIEWFINLYFHLVMLMVQDIQITVGDVIRGL